MDNGDEQADYEVGLKSLSWKEETYCVPVQYKCLQCKVKFKCITGSLYEPSSSGCSSGPSSSSSSSTCNGFKLGGFKDIQKWQVKIPNWANRFFRRR